MSKFQNLGYRSTFECAFRLWTDIFQSTRVKNILPKIRIIRKLSCRSTYGLMTSTHLNIVLGWAARRASQIAPLLTESQVVIKRMNIQGGHCAKSEELKNRKLHSSQNK